MLEEGQGDPGSIAGAFEEQKAESHSKQKGSPSTCRCVAGAGGLRGWFFFPVLFLMIVP